jgi:hypothetical protein
MRQKKAIKVTVEPSTAQTEEKILIVVGDGEPVVWRESASKLAF